MKKIYTFLAIFLAFLLVNCGSFGSGDNGGILKEPLENLENNEENNQQPTIAPTLTELTPNEVVYNGNDTIQISGSDFASDNIVKLTKDDWTSDYSINFISSELIEVTFDQILPLGQLELRVKTSDDRQSNMLNITTTGEKITLDVESQEYCTNREYDDDESSRYLCTEQLEPGTYKIDTISSNSRDMVALQFKYILRDRVAVVDIGEDKEVEDNFFKQDSNEHNSAFELTEEVSTYSEQLTVRNNNKICFTYRKFYLNCSNVSGQTTYQLYRVE